MLTADGKMASGLRRLGRSCDLSARRYVYVWAERGLSAGPNGRASEIRLVLIGATPEGKKELVGFPTGVHGRDAQSWREKLIDIKQRGLEDFAPDLAVGDGALGF